MDLLGVFATTSLVASWVVLAIWVLTTVQVVVSEVVAVEVAAIVGSDMAVAAGGSGHVRGGCRLCRRAVGHLGSVCHHFRGSGGGFEAGMEWWWLLLTMLATLMAAVLALSAMTWWHQRECQGAW